MIIQELEKEAQIIRDKSNPVKFYNYSYLKEILEKKHKVVVSLPTIIARAKSGSGITINSWGNNRSRPKT